VQLYISFCYLFPPSDKQRTQQSVSRLRHIVCKFSFPCILVENCSNVYIFELFSHLVFFPVTARFKLPDSRLQYLVHSSVSMHPSQGIYGGIGAAVVVVVNNYTGCPRRKGPNFGRVFLRSNYTDITQNTYIQS
jgi:hypothetical protein